MKKIGRPSWENLYDRSGDLVSLNDTFNDWFDKNVEPINEMLSKCIEVTGFSIDGEGVYMGEKKASSDTHKALLISMELIKKETAEDILRDWVYRTIQSDKEENLFEYERDILNRANRILEEK